jgi:hypothetical protein
MNSDDDELLRELGRAVRAAERSADARREERLSSHSLEPNELQEMQARAERDAELARALDAHAPLDTQAKARISAELVAVAQRQSALPDAAPAAQPGRVVALDPRAARARRAAWLVLPLSAAAAALLWLAGSRHVAPLPAYALQISGARAEMRSGPALIDGADANAAVRVGSDTQLRMLLRPATAVSGEVGARVYLARGDALRAWPAQVQPAESGALQLVLAVPPEPVAGAEARIVVARPELLAHAESLARGADAHGAGYQVWRVQLTPAE